MRVALIGPYPADISHIPGGVPAVVFYLSEALRRITGLDLHVIAPIKHISRDRVETADGVTIHYLRLPERRLVPNQLSAVRRIRNVLGRVQPDVVHGQNVTGTLAGLASGMPTIHSIHGILHEEIRFGPTLPQRLSKALEARLACWAVRRVQHCIAASQYAGNAYAGTAKGKMHYICNPVEDRFFDMENRDIDRRLFSAAVISRLKNQLGLARAFRLVSEQDSSAHLYVCGKVVQPKYYERVKKYVESHNLRDCVHLLGFISQDELGRHFSECSVIALFSMQESAPVLVAQAMCAGKPVLASAVGGTPDMVIDGETGYLVSAGDEVAFAHKALDLLSDVGLRRKMGSRSREIANERYRKEVVGAQTVSVYREAISDGTA